LSIQNSPSQFQKNSSKAKALLRPRKNFNSLNSHREEPAFNELPELNKKLIFTEDKNYLFPI